MSKKLVAGERLPSKRLLAKNLNVSTITVENAYSQLVAEVEIYNDKMEKMESAPHPKMQLYVRLDRPVSAGMILRRQE